MSRPVATAFSLLCLLCVPPLCALEPAPAARPAAPRAAAAQVTKVEPPSWWPGHSVNPVRLLVRGSGLAGARVVAAGDGLAAGAVKVNDAGTYLFLDVTIDPKAAAGAAGDHDPHGRAEARRYRSSCSRRCRARAASRASRRTTRST